LVKQQEAYNTLKTKNDTLKSEYDALYAKAYDGTATDAEYDELDRK